MSEKRKKILLWADARVQCPNSNSSSSRDQKRKAADPFGLTSKLQQIESKVDDVVADLKKKETSTHCHSFVCGPAVSYQEIMTVEMSLLIFLQLLVMDLKNQKSNHLVMHLLKLPAPSLLKLSVDLKLNNLVMRRLLFLEARLKHLLSSALVRVLTRNPLCSLQERSQSCEVKSCKN